MSAENALTTDQQVSVLVASTQEAPALDWSDSDACEQVAYKLLDGEGFLSSSAVDLELFFMTEEGKKQQANGLQHSGNCKNNTSNPLLEPSRATRRHALL